MGKRWSFSSGKLIAGERFYRGDSMLMKKAFIIIIISLLFFFLFYNCSVILNTRKSVPVPVEKTKKTEQDRDSIEEKMEDFLKENQKGKIIRSVCQNRFYLLEKGKWMYICLS